MSRSKLKRSLGLLLVTFYGLGNILGAGIYVLVGKVAGEAGYLVPFAFLLASIVAAISAYTYASMATRYPVSAGAAVYIHEGFGIQKISVLVGVLIALSGIVSSAVISHGFAGYVAVFTDLPSWLVIVVMLLTLCLVSVWGIKQSVMLASIMTVIEITGLLIIVFVGSESVAGIEQMTSLWRGEFSKSDFAYIGVITGAFLAFYAYIGFEDMVNLAEEVKNPKVIMPLSIALCVILSTLIYSMVAMVSISVVKPDMLAASSAPLAEVYHQATGKEPVLISLIGIFAVVNGALIQMIMSSRLLYGMAYKQWLPEFLSRVNATTHTPVNSTLVTTAIMLLLALSLELTSLAELTSYLVLFVFALVNLSLLMVVRREQVFGVLYYRIWLPVAGFLASSALMLVKFVIEIAV